MTDHLHSEFVPGCYRCDLSQDEVPFRPDDTTGLNALTIRCDFCGLNTLDGLRGYVFSADTRWPGRWVKGARFHEACEAETRRGGLD